VNDEIVTDAGLRYGASHLAEPVKLTAAASAMRWWCWASDTPRTPLRRLVVATRRPPEDLFHS
jgi:hypothetical protein